MSMVNKDYHLIRRPENPTTEPNMKWILAEIMAVRNLPKCDVGRSVRRSVLNIYIVLMYSSSLR